jgi:hypothetical protein
MKNEAQHVEKLPNMDENGKQAFYIYENMHCTCEG